MRSKRSPDIRRWVVVATGFVTAFPATSHACVIRVPANLEDVRFADVVVVGRVANYRIVRDEDSRRRMLASPRLPAEMRWLYEDPHESLLSDYARFDVRVEAVLVGSAPSTLSVTWDNSTFGEPEQMAAGPYLIALRRPSSASPPLRGPSATVFSSPDPRVLTLLQAPCSVPFIYEVGSEQAATIQRILGARPR